MKVTISGIEMVSNNRSGLVGVLLQYTNPADGDLLEDHRSAMSENCTVFLTKDERMKRADELMDAL